MSSCTLKPEITATITQSHQWREAKEVPGEMMTTTTETDLWKTGTEADPTSGKIVINLQTEPKAHKKAEIFDQEAMKDKTDGKEKHTTHNIGTRTDPTHIATQDTTRKLEKWTNQKIKRNSN